MLSGLGFQQGLLQAAASVAAQAGKSLGRLATILSSNKLSAMGICCFHNVSPRISSVMM